MAPVMSDAHPQLRQLKRFALVVLVVAVVVAAGASTRAIARASDWRPSGARQPSRWYTWYARSAARSPTSWFCPGNVQAFTDAPIYARTSGYLKRWYADIGAHVKAGELLAVIETPEVDAQYRQAQADYDAAVANNKLSQLTAGRYQRLGKTGLVALQDVDNAQGDADAKKAQLESALQNLGRLRQLESFNRITAPFDGEITARRIDVGALVTEGSSTGQELFHLTATRQLRIYIQVPEAYSSLIRPGLGAQLALVERPDRLFPARIVSTARAIDTSTRTLLTELQTDNDKGELLPGAFAQVHLPLPAGLASWRLPSDALLFRADGLHVATVDGDGRVLLKTVRVGRDFGATIEILDGVDAQDEVIISPPDSVANGQIVHVHEPQGAAEETAAGAPQSAQGLE